MRIIVEDQHKHVEWVENGLLIFDDATSEADWRGRCTWYYTCRVSLSWTTLQQKSAGQTCPYCRCEIRGTETVCIEPFEKGGANFDRDAINKDGSDEDDHEDIELMVREMAALKKVREQTKRSCWHGITGRWWRLGSDVNTFRRLSDSFSCWSLSGLIGFTKKKYLLQCIVTNDQNV